MVELPGNAKSTWHRYVAGWTDSVQWIVDGSAWVLVSTHGFTNTVMRVGNQFVLFDICSPEVRVQGVPQNPEFANLFETEITDVISNTKVVDAHFLSHRSDFPFPVNNRS
jgi:hypothetical protein